jgi:hypothetical protein
VPELAQYDQLLSRYQRHLNRIMPCPEYNRLRQHYEAALRRWGYVLLSLDVGAAVRQTAGIIDERNAAKERLSAHVLSCSACNAHL